MRLSSESPYSCDDEQVSQPDAVVLKAYVKGSFENSESINVSLSQFADAGRARAAFDATAKAYETCGTQAHEGVRVTYSLVDYPQVGERSVAIRADLLAKQVSRCTEAATA